MSSAIGVPGQPGYVPAGVTPTAGNGSSSQQTSAANNLLNVPQLSTYLNAPANFSSTATPLQQPNSIAAQTFNQANGQQYGTPFTPSNGQAQPGMTNTQGVQSSGLPPGISPQAVAADPQGYQQWLQQGQATMGPQWLQQLQSGQWGSPGQVPGSLQAALQPQNIGANVAPAQNYGGAQLGQASQINPLLTQGITNANTPDLSSNAQIQQILQAFQPQARQGQAQLQDQLAASGLSGGPAIAAQNNLQSQQTQALAPTLAAAIQQSQSNQLGAGQFNTTQLMNTLTGNMSALNSNNQLQANLQQQAGMGNQSAQNSQSQLQAQLNQQAGLANQDAINTANTTNVGAQNVVNATNTAGTNQANQNYLSAMMQQYQNQFAAFNGVNDAGLNTQNTIASSGANNYGTAGSNPFADIGSSLSSVYAPTAKAATAAA